MPGTSPIVVDTRKSPHASLSPLPITSVTLSGFLAGWQRTNREASLQHGYDRIAESGVFDNFRVAAGKATGTFRGNMVFSDTDLYKWIEAASFELAIADRPQLRKQVDDAIALIGAAQMDDGYINTHFQVTGIDGRWTKLEKHEMYCIGHLIQAAIAHHRASGSDTFLRTARRAADHVDSIFGPGKRPGCPGHPEIEMALVELYRETGEKRYLTLCRELLGNRGKGYVNGKVMYGDHRDAIGITEPEGHAVMQLYLLCGITDCYLETGERVLIDSAKATWESMSERRVAITGGVGVRPKSEAFGADYELPNEQTYNETCAQIASVMWCWRLLLATGEARYADLMERTIYNGILPGVNIDGKAWFYGNGLLSRKGGRRNPWDFNCACCPPNAMRAISSLGGYIATTTDTGVQIHLYEAGTIRAVLGGPGGRTGRGREASGGAEGEVSLSVQTRYPWDGAVKVTIAATPDREWALSLRVPEWAQGATVAVNGRTWNGSAQPGTYAVIGRSWRTGDTVELSFPMPVLYCEGHPHIDATRGALAITRGPLVYCIEGQDQSVELLDCRLDRGGTPATAWRGDLLGGLQVVTAPGFAHDRSSWGRRLYRPAAGGAAPAGRAVPAGGAAPVGGATPGPAADRLGPATLTAIPYFAWANRAPSPMRVWIPAE